MKHLLLFTSAFTVGVLLLCLEYFISKKVLLHNVKYYSLVSVIRLFINIIYLATLFFIVTKTNLNPYCILIGGALGITVPNIFFISKLLKFSQNKNSNDKTEDNHG